MMVKLLRLRKCAAIVAVNEALNALAFDSENPRKNTQFVILKVKQEIEREPE
jgi:hypothetical protein